MSDQRGAQAGVGADTAMPAGNSEAEIVSRIEGLLDDTPPPRQRRQPAPAPEPTEIPTESGADEAPDDAGPDDSPTTGDDDDREEAEPEGGEESTAPAIEPPTSWSAQDKALFSQLPPEAQQVIARRESERDRVVQQRTQEIAEQRKAFEQHWGAIQSERQQYETNLQQLLRVALPEAERFANVDWQRLATEDPSGYVRLTAERDALRGRVGAIQAELQQVQSAQQQEAARHYATVRAEQHQKLVELLPDFGDPEKGPKLASEMRGWLQSQGFTPEEIGQVIDHRVLRVVERAMRADRAAAARESAEAKRSAAAPTVQQPGAARPRSDLTAAQRHQRNVERYQRTGKEADAIRMLMDRL